jgi:hypothetical protein
VSAYGSTFFTTTAATSQPLILSEPDGPEEYLSLAEAGEVFAVAPEAARIDYRTNLTMRQLAPLFGVSPATVCRVIQRLGPVLAIEPARASQDAAERLWIVDGTLVPVRDRKVGASSRNYRFSANVQVIVDAETRLVVATARPLPGNTADAKAWRDSGLSAHCEGVTLIGDGAYINTGLVVPQRTPGATPAEGLGGGQRAASQGPCPRRAHLLPQEELQDPP